MNHVESFTLSPKRKKTVMAFAKEYNDWMREYRIVSDTKKSQRMDVIRAQNTGIGRPTENLAIRKVELLRRINLIEETAREADPFHWRYLLRGVTEGRAYELLLSDGIACSRNTYYTHRKRFYYILSDKMSRLGV